MLQPDEKGRINSLTTALMQETDRFNKLLGVIKVSKKHEKKCITCKRRLYLLS